MVFPSPGVHHWFQIEFTRRSILWWFQVSRSVKLYKSQYFWLTQGSKQHEHYVKVQSPMQKMPDVFANYFTHNSSVHIYLSRTHSDNHILPLDKNLLPFYVEQPTSDLKIFHSKDAKRIFDYSNIRIPHTIRIVNLTFEFLFVLIKYAYRA